MPDISITSLTSWSEYRNYIGSVLKELGLSTSKWYSIMGPGIYDDAKALVELLLDVFNIQNTSTKVKWRSEINPLDNSSRVWLKELTAELIDRHGWYEGAYIAADFSKGYYTANGTQLTTEQEWLDAFSAVKSGITRTFGPFYLSGELMKDPSFTGLITDDGWVIGPSYTGVGTLSYDGSGNLGLTHTATGQCRFGFQIPDSTTLRAYEYSSTLTVAQNLTGGATLNGGASNRDLGSAPGSASFNVNGLPSSVSAIFSPAALVAYCGSNFNASSLSGSPSKLSQSSLKEVGPLPKWVANALSFRLKGVTPAVASGNKVGLQLDTPAGERDRVRVVWDSSKHLRIIITAFNVEQANLDLGVVNESTSFDIRFTGTRDSFYARLGNLDVVTDTSGFLPGMSHMRLGRSFTGETWDGEITSFQLWPEFLPSRVIDVRKTLGVYGDSTAAASGASTFNNSWYYLLYSSYDPDRYPYRDATGGQSVTTMASRFEADTAHVDWTTIFYDRLNTGETADLWMDSIRRCVEHLKTDRFLIMPQVQYADNAETEPNKSRMIEINRRIKEMYPNNTFDADTEAAFLLALSPGSTRADGLHRNDAGQLIEYTFMRAWLDRKGW